MIPTRVLNTQKRVDPFFHSNRWRSSANNTDILINADEGDIGMGGIFQKADNSVGCVFSALY